MDKNTASKTKIVSIVISLGIIATLIIGVISVEGALIPIEIMRITLLILMKLRKMLQ